MKREELINSINEEVASIFDENLDFLARLYERWQWEKEYEDWKEYEEVMKKQIGAAFIRATKRPFGFKVLIFNVPVQLAVRVKRPGVLEGYASYDVSSFRV